MSPHEAPIQLKCLHMKKYCSAIIFSLMMLSSDPAGAEPRPVPVATFKNICALTTDKIEDFIVCVQITVREQNKGYLADNFNNQVKQLGSLTRPEVVKTVCRSVGDDGSVITGEYLDGVDDDKEFVIEVFRSCGFTGAQR